MAYYSYCTQLYKAPQGTFFYWSIQRNSALFQPYVWSGTSHLKNSTTMEPAFLRREAAWVCPYLQRQGCCQNLSLTGHVLIFAYSAYYCGGSDDHL